MGLVHSTSDPAMPDAISNPRMWAQSGFCKRIAAQHTRRVRGGVRVRVRVGGRVRIRVKVRVKGLGLGVEDRVGPFT